MATRFLNISSNGNKILKSKLMTAPSYMVIFNFSFLFSIGCNPSTGLCPPNCKFAVWADWASWSECSASCGGGERMVEHICKDSNTGTTVNAGLCDLQVLYLYFNQTETIVPTNS